MIEEIINWIDKDLNEISSSKLFLRYFENKEIIRDETDYYVSNESKGIEIVASLNFEINAVHLFSEHGIYRAYEGKLPSKVDFSLNNIDVHSILGKPNKTGGGNKALYIGLIPLWDKYYFDNYTLHFQYSADKFGIDMITIGSLKLEEYFNSEMQ